MYLFQKIYYSCGIVIILSLCFPSRIPKQLVFYYLPCSFYWERPCFKWSVTLDMYIIGEIKTGILFKDFYICTTYRKRQKFELISYCFFVPHADFQVILGKKIYIHFVFKVAYFDPPWVARKKRRIIYFWGVTRKKNFCGKKNALLKHFFKDFLAQNGFHMTSNIKTSNHHRAIFWWNYVHDFSTKVVLIWEIAANTDFQFVAGQHLNLKMQILTTKMITLKFKKIQWSIKTHFDGQNHNKIEFQNSNFWQETI